MIIYDVCERFMNNATSDSPLINTSADCVSSKQPLRRNKWFEILCAKGAFLSHSTLFPALFPVKIMRPARGAVWPRIAECRKFPERKKELGKTSMQLELCIDGESHGCMRLNRACTSLRYFFDLGMHALSHIISV